MAGIDRGGYDYAFLSEVPDKLKCAICLLVLKDPLQFTRCGHRFCKLCIQPVMNRPGHPFRAEFLCPKDRLLTTQKEVFEDTACKREVLDLCVKCPFNSCKWTGELRDVESHRTTCLFGTLKCSNDNCDKVILRSALLKHQTTECLWRRVQCVYCKEFYVRKYTKIHNNMSCKRYPVTCPNKCGMHRTAREEVESHVKTDCPRTIVPCTHMDVGCTAKLQRNALQVHLQTNVHTHLKLACAELKAVRNQVANVVHGPTSTIFIWRITDYNQKLQNAKNGTAPVVNSEPFYTTPPGYRIGLEFYPNGDGDPMNNSHASVLLHIKKGEYDTIVSWPFKCQTTVSLIKRERDKGKRKNLDYMKCFPRPTSCEDGVRLGRAYMLPQDKMRKPFIVDDTLFLQVEVQTCESQKRQRLDVSV